MCKSEQLVVGSIAVGGGGIFKFSKQHAGLNANLMGFSSSSGTFWLFVFTIKCSFTVDIGPFAHIVHSYLVLEVISLGQIEPH